ncbi:DUF2569 domain-containing protein [Xenorhabdus sp. KJ12.1]|uniref:DUF2569 domain-containing protein n=1 Tax=Xenorhabdus sp. KJ12.1 TaxID=1851571 RepID=UPI000C03B670|nr:DUF2569 domain-containing protein [Xenorhabdus sp. KJ12.1]PHM70335.1 hypothetical protein Xekj_01963 [Xenorhabdus sp. KJ12.1]
MDKWVCTKCGEKEIPQDTEYCEGCEEKSFKKIGGWLYLPAIGLIVMILSSITGIVTTINEIFPFYSQLTDRWKCFITFAFILDLLIFLLIIVTTIFFFRKSKKTPYLFISLLILNITVQGIMIFLTINVMSAPVEPNYTLNLIRSILHAAVWIPYFIVSVRVKKTFVN